MKIRIHYIIPALLLALSCTRQGPSDHYGEVGRLNAPGDAWEPTAVAVAPDGTVYVVDSSLNCAVHIFDANGVFVGSIGGVGEGPGELFVPTDVAVGPGGNIYVTEFGTHRVSVFRNDGTIFKTFGEAELLGPFGVAPAPDGKVYVADARAGGLLVFSPEGELLETWGEDRDTSRVLDVAVSSDGGVAYAPGAEGDGLFLAAGGAEPTRLSAGGNSETAPAEVAFGPRGNIFILGQRTDAGGALENFVAELSRRGELTEEIPVSLTSPSALAVAPDGTLYVADGSRHDVRIYKPGQADTPK